MTSTRLRIVSTLLVFVTVLTGLATHLWVARTHPTPHRELVDAALEEPAIRAEAGSLITEAITDRLGPLGRLEATGEVIGELVASPEADALVADVVEARVAQTKGLEPGPVLIDPAVLFGDGSVFGAWLDVLPVVQVRPDAVDAALPFAIAGRVALGGLAVLAGLTLLIARTAERRIAARHLGVALMVTGAGCLIARQALLALPPTLVRRLIAAVLHMPVSVGLLLLGVGLVVSARPMRGAETAVSYRPVVTF